MYALVGLLIGVIVGFLMPWSIPAQYSIYAAVVLLAAMDAAAGGINARLRHRFKPDLFISGAIGNGAIAVFLTYIGERLGISLYLAAVVVFGTRLFQNFGEIRRELLTVRRNRNTIKQIHDIEGNPPSDKE